MSIHILIFLIFTCEINASCTEPRHDQQQFCGAQNAFTAVVDGVWGPAGDPFDRTYRVTVKNIYRGSDIVPNTTITLYGRSHSCGPTILDIKKEYAIYATKYGPRLEVVTHEEVPPASIARLKMYDCSCQIEIHRPNMSNTLRYEDSLDKCIVTTHGRDCQFRNGYCKKTNNLCSWELFPRAHHRMNCVQNV